MYFIVQSDTVLLLSFYFHHLACVCFLLSVYFRQVASVAKQHSLVPPRVGDALQLGTISWSIQFGLSSLGWEMSIPPTLRSDTARFIFKKNYINVDLYSLVSSWWQMHCGIWYCGVKVTCMATTMIWSASRRLCGEWVLHWCLPASSSLETMSIVESMALRLSGFFILILKYAYKFKNEQRKSRVYCSL